MTTQAPQGIASFQVNETGQYLAENELAVPAYDMSMESIITKLAWLLPQGFSYSDFNHKIIEDLHGEVNVENELI